MRVTEYYLRFFRKNVRNNWGAGACVAHYQNVCDLRVDKNPRTLTVCQTEIDFALND